MKFLTDQRERKLKIFGQNYQEKVLNPVKFNFNLPLTHNSFIYLIEGEIKIGDKNHKKVKNSTLILLTMGNKLKVKGIIKFFKNNEK